MSYIIILAAAALLLCLTSSEVINPPSVQARPNNQVSSRMCELPDVVPVVNARLVVEGFSIFHGFLFEFKVSRPFEPARFGYFP